MAEKRRDSDLSSELYFSVYEKNRKLKPQKIKTYALYKPLLENTTATNFVLASKGKKDLLVSFKDGSESKVFDLDKVFYSDIPQDEFHLFTKSVIQDVIIGLNSFLILYKLVCPASSEIKSSFGMDLSKKVIANVLKELFLFVNKEENMDCSLHLSYFEMHGDKIIDLLNECDENRKIQIYGNPEKDCFEIKGLTEKPLIEYKDIADILNKPHSSGCIAACCHLLIIVTMVKKYIDNGLEFIKVGKLTLIGPTDCKSGCLENASPNTDDCLMKFAEYEYSTSSKNNILAILKPAFGKNVTTTFIVLLSSVLHCLEKDLKILEFVSKFGSIMTNPEIDLELNTRNSIKEYTEEIKDLQKVIHATSKCIGVSVDPLLYRSLENKRALENKKVQNLKGQLLQLTDGVNSKKQKILELQAALASKESKLEEVKESSKMVSHQKSQLKNEENNAIQEISLKADAIVAEKRVTTSYVLYLKKLKQEVVKANRNYEELTRSTHFLKDELASVLWDINAQNTSHKRTLELLIVDMNNTFLEFQSLEKDLTAKLSNLRDIDVLIMAWKNCMENLTTKFSSFIHKTHELFSSMKLEMSTSLANLHASKMKVEDIISNWSEKKAILEYYFSKLQVFCDSSFKLLKEIIHQMNVIENCYKTEFNSISAAFGSTNEAFKKFDYDIKAALESFQQYFEEQKEDALKMADIICFHRKFKKKFNRKINDVMQSLLGLKQMYLDYNDSSTSEWNEILKGCQKTKQKHNDLSDHLSLFQIEISKYIDNLSQQNFNALEYSPLKNKTNNVENRILQLLNTHKEIKGNLGEAFEAHKKGIDEEFQEVEKYMNLQKTEIGKHFDTFSLKLKDSTSNFVEELRSINEISWDNKDKFEKDLDSASSCVSLLEPMFNNYLSTSNNILAKTEQSFISIPSVSDNKNDNVLDIESLMLEEWKVNTSTPNIPKKTEFNNSLEKEKLINRVKSLAEQQIPQKSTCTVSEYEEKEVKNVSTVSLPNPRTQSNVRYGIFRVLIVFI